MKTVLVADDEQEMLGAFRIVFSPFSEEIRLLTASDGREAVELLSSEAVDLLVTDLNMPVLSGFQVLAQLAKDHKSIPVIVTTGHDSPLTRQQLSAFGPLTYIEKPFQLSEVVEKVRLALGQAAKGRIEGITLASFLQLLNLEGKTCSIRVESQSRQGTVEVVRGEVVDAQRGGERGESALVEMLGWDDLEIRSDAVGKIHGQTIERGLMEILLEGAERRDRGQRGLLGDWELRGSSLRERSTWLQTVELALSRLLVESSSSAPGLPEILGTLARHLTWHFAAYWCWRRPSETLHCEAVWIDPTLADAARIDEAAAQGFLAGQSLVRRVSRSRKAAWVADVDLDPDFVGGNPGSLGSFRSALAFPVANGDAVLGVVDLRSSWRREPDTDLLRWLADFGPRLARYLENSRSDRLRAELIEREQKVLGEISTLESRASFIAEASAVLSCSLEEPVLIGGLVRLALSRLADWCVVDLFDSSGELRRAAVVHKNPLNLEWAEELRLAPSPFADAGSPVVRIVRTGNAEICGTAAETRAELSCLGESNGEILKRLGLHSAMIVPLSARNRTLGALTLVSGDPGRVYDPGDLETARELAHRAALAIENARLAESRANSVHETTAAESPSSLSA